MAYNPFETSSNVCLVGNEPYVVTFLPYGTLEPMRGIFESSCDIECMNYIEDNDLCWSEVGLERKSQLPQRVIDTMSTFNPSG